MRIAHRTLYPMSANITPNAAPMKIYPVSTGMVYGNAFFSASTDCPIVSEAAGWGPDI